MAQRRAAARLKAFSSLLCLALLGSIFAAVPALAQVGPEQDPIFTQELSQLADGDVYDGIVHLVPDTATPRSFLEDRGLKIHDAFQTVDAFHVTGPAKAFRSLTTESSVTYLEANRRLQMYDETHAWATGARIAQEAVAGGPYLDAQGRPLEGNGIGVAIVDSGVNAAHPDLQDRVVKNFKWHCASIALSSTATERCYGATVFLGEVQGTSDTTSGHGTHVAGIVAGDGTASQETFEGVAPRSSLYGFGVGEVIFVANAAEAFEYILANNNDRSKLPVPIKVINNSWGDDDIDGNPNVEGPAYNPKSLLAKLTKQLVDSGVTMVFAAGNGDDATSGSDGTHFNTSSTCQDPTPGVICVANYDDAATGTKSGALNSSSSRGKFGVAQTYPDISAPGTNITSACIRQVQPICNLGIVDEARWAPYYGTISGTSMASPHVAGIVAMLLQARPDLTPAAVEDVLVDNALKFTTKDRFGSVVPYEFDPQNPDGTTSYDKGAGLADVPAALTALGITGQSASSPASPVSGDGGDFAASGAADLVGVSVAEETAGMRYTIELRNVSDAAAGTTLRLYQMVGGASKVTQLVVTSTGASASTATGAVNTAPAKQVAVNRANNTVSFLLPFDTLGNPAAGTPAHNVYLVSMIGTYVDMAPGGLGADVFTSPRYGAAYTIHPIAPDLSVPTQVAFTESSVTSAQYSDDAVLEARLTKGVEPVAGAPVTFTVGGFEVSGTTDEAGLARVSFPLEEAPGAYEATVRYAGVPDVLKSSSASMPFTILQEIVSIDFTAASPTSGQYSDDTFVAVTAVDDDGTPLNGQAVTLALGSTSEQVTLTDGAARADFTLLSTPGLYDRTATFAGNEFYAADSATGTFDLQQEITKVTLRVSGKGLKRTLTATLVDDDGTALGSRTIQFSADGAPMPNGTEVTNSDGVATYYPSGKYASAKSYAATYAGDTNYVGSSSS